ncbi:hypothetical protein, partial [Candidatus Ichthyocystis hellenicum]|uniref:hypothetical protein n=1 Tax=Candidatus Ichthyocystis hellenicum TaxID=1561003 RepID=UPI001111AB88
MSYTNSRHLDCSQGGNLELQLDNEVVEEGECAAVMVAEQGAQRNCRSTRSSLSRSLTSSFISTPLVILSMLECANGSVMDGIFGVRVGEDVGSSYVCLALSQMCRLMNIARNSNSNGSISRIVLKPGRVCVLRKNEGEDLCYSGALLDVNKEENKGENNDVSLHNIALTLEVARRDAVTYSEEFGLNKSSENYIFCSHGVASFCDGEHRENATLLDECCPGIHSYISGVVHSTTSSTVASEVTNSTTLAPEVTNFTTLASEVTNSTSVESTIFTPTEIIPINKDLTIFVVVLVAFLSLAVALLSFVGYKRCSQKKVQQVQHVSQSDDSSDEE